MPPALHPGPVQEDVNPATGDVEDKHFWLVLHDGLVFGSGWHHDALGGTEPGTT